MTVALQRCELKGMVPILLVTCNYCGAVSATDNHADPDSAVRCVTEEGDPAGSVTGSCCTAGHSHEEHADHVRRTGDASCRTMTIIVPPGTVAASLA